MPAASPYDTSLGHVRQRLDAHAPERVEPGPRTRQAAVAVILREDAVGDGSASEMLFIKRADKAGDPWSGHMAYPGGHREPQDAGLREAAERETLEEIGLDLTQHGTYLGAVGHQRAAPRGRTLDMLIAPEVYALHSTPPLEPNYEVADIVWVSVAELLDNRYHHVREFDMAGTPTPFNGYLLPQGYFIWGLTYRMLKTLFGVLYPAWEAADEIISED